MSKPPTPSGEIVNSYNDYYNFDNGVKSNDDEDFQAKLQAWLTMAKNHSQSPEVLLTLFWTMVVVGGSTPEGGLAGDGSSFTRNQEDDLVEVSKELNYASAYRDTVAEIKNQLVQPATGSVSTVTDDLTAMDTYRDASKFNDNAPPIFQNADSTFKQAESDITGILGKIGTTYKSFQDLYDQAQAVQPGTTNTASNDFQTYVNAADSLFSAVGVQQNVLSTQMQDTEANYKSYLSSDTQGYKSLLSISTFAIQHSISS